VPVINAGGYVFSGRVRKITPKKRGSGGIRAPCFIYRESVTWIYRVQSLELFVFPSFQSALQSIPSFIHLFLAALQSFVFSCPFLYFNFQDEGLSPCASRRCILCFRRRYWRARNVRRRRHTRGIRQGHDWRWKCSLPGS
jgi:hypothetical protein